jgi:hypothetical protein
LKQADYDALREQLVTLPGDLAKSYVEKAWSRERTALDFYNTAEGSALMLKLHLIALGRKMVEVARRRLARIEARQQRKHRWDGWRLGDERGVIPFGRRPR